jgi:hypothetical protein
MADVRIPKLRDNSPQAFEDWSKKINRFLGFILYNLDSDNVIESLRAKKADIAELLAGSIRADQIDASFGRIQTAQIEDLIVGPSGNVQLASDARLSWLNIDDKPYIPPEYTDMDALAAIQATYIDANGVWTPNVYATHISTLLGKITTAMIENLIVGSNVQMGPGAYISWANVTGQPYIPQNAEDVGAKPYDWYPGISDVTGLPGRLTYIDGGGIYTHTIYADQINTAGLGAEKIYKPGYPNDYASISGDYADLTLYYGNNPYFKIYNDGVGSIDLQRYGVAKLSFAPYDTRPLGAWNFSEASVTGLSVVAKFS